MKNIELRVLRQRLIIEGLLRKMIYRLEIDDYLRGLSIVSGMNVVLGPMGFDGHPGGGSASWIHWNSSGAHFYIYSASPHSNYKSCLKYPLFTLDTYTCKPFSIKKVVEYTRKVLHPIKMVYSEVNILRL